MLFMLFFILIIYVMFNYNFVFAMILYHIGTVNKHTNTNTKVDQLVFIFLNLDETYDKCNS